MEDSPLVAELQFDVDEMTLDYLTQMAIMAVIDEVSSWGEMGPSRSSATEPLMLVESFLHLFKARYPRQDASANVLFRLHLLTFASLFARRFSHSPLTPSAPHLQSLLSQNSARASRLTSQRGLTGHTTGLNNPNQSLSDAQFLACLMSDNENERLSLDAYLALFGDPEDVDLQERLATNRQEITSAQQVSQDPDAMGDSLSLLDLFPVFLAVFAGQDLSDRSWSLPPRWLQLVRDYRIQAVLEEARVFGNTGVTVLREALAWSPSMIRTTYANASRDEFAIRSMFSTFSEEDTLYWIRSEVELVELLEQPLSSSHNPNTAAMDHLDELSARFPRRAFEEKLLSALQYIASLPEKPILIQLEEGRLEGLSVAETADLMARCGL